MIRRQLSHTALIRPSEVQSVAKPAAGKPVFILSGVGSVVVKIESPGNVESGPEFAARERATSELAQVALANAPGVNPMQVLDFEAIKALKPNTVAGPVAELQATLADVGQQGALQNAVALKLEKVEVGRNLLDMAREGRGATKYGGAASVVGSGYGPVKLKSGNERTRSAVTNLITNNAICTAFGRLAAFDLVVNNYDRFHPDGTVNLENLDFTPAIAQLVPTVLPLDNLSFQFPLTPQWAGEQHMASRNAMRAYATSVLKHLHQKAGLDDPVAVATIDAVTAGMVHSATALQAYAATISARTNGFGGAAAGRTQEQLKVDTLLLGRLRKIDPT